MSDELVVTILGSGSSGGVPRIGNDWGACDPTEPRNRRRRCSILVQRNETNVLIDTSPDLREQLNDVDVDRLDAVLYTHDHADQSHGIDELRVVALRNQARVEMHADPVTAQTLRARFGYCFGDNAHMGYPAIANLSEFGSETILVDGPGGPIEAIPFPQDHGSVTSYGFRVGPVAYSSDLVDLPDESWEALAGVDCWIVDALRYKPHPTHAHLEKTLGWIERLKPKHAVLTNLHVDLDYQTLKAELPDGVEPAYDGMTIRFSGS